MQFHWNGREENCKYNRARGDQRSAAIISDRDIKRRSSEQAERKVKSIMSLLHDTRCALGIRDEAINAEH